MNRFDINDNNIVEKESFSVYENSLNAIIEKIERKDSQETKKFILLKEGVVFIKTLLNIKKRNPFFLNNPDTMNTVLATNKKIKNEILEEKSLWEERLKTEGLTLSEAFAQMEEVGNRPGFVQDMIRLSLYFEGKGDTSGALNQIALLLIKKIWYIHETTIDNLFITSDNPGFCTDYFDQLLNLNFLGEFTFIFPLSPLLTLEIRSTDNDSIVLPCKEILYKPATSEFVRDVNRCTLANSNFIYSSSSLTLEKVINNYKDYYQL